MNPQRLIIIIALTGLGLSLALAIETPRTASPISHFRQLLELNTQQREAIILRQEPSTRRILERKLEEYASLSEGEKEFRLFATELHFYLEPMIGRDSSIEKIPADRIPDSIIPHLRTAMDFWNQLPVSQRDLLLSKKKAITYLITLTYSSARLSAIVPEQSDEWESLNRFLALSLDKQKAFLNSYGLAGNTRIVQVLEKMASLSADQRDRSVHALTCYLSFPPAMKDRFMDGVHTWNSMKPTERTVWRQIADRYPRVKPAPLPFSTQTAEGPYPPFPVPAEPSVDEEKWFPAPPLPPGLRKTAEIPVPLPGPGPFRSKN